MVPFQNVRNAEDVADLFVFTPTRETDLQYSHLVRVREIESGSKAHTMGSVVSADWRVIKDFLFACAVLAYLQM